MSIEPPEDMLDDADPQGVSNTIDLALERDDADTLERCGRYFVALARRRRDEQRGER